MPHGKHSHKHKKHRRKKGSRGELHDDKILVLQDLRCEETLSTNTLQVDSKKIVFHTDSTDPADKEAILLLASVYFDAAEESVTQGSIENAIQLYIQSVKLVECFLDIKKYDQIRNTLIKYLHALVIHLLGQENYDTAFQYLQKIANISDYVNPNTELSIGNLSDVFYKLGKCFAKKGEFGKACDCFEEAKKIILADKTTEKTPLHHRKTSKCNVKIASILVKNKNPTAYSYFENAASMLEKIPQQERNSKDNYRLANCYFYMSENLPTFTRTYCIDYDRHRHKCILLEGAFLLLDMAWMKLAIDAAERRNQPSLDSAIKSDIAQLKRAAMHEAESWINLASKNKEKSEFLAASYCYTKAVKMMLSSKFSLTIEEDRRLATCYYNLALCEGQSSDFSMKQGVLLNFAIAIATLIRCYNTQYAINSMSLDFLQLFYTAQSSPLNHCVTGARDGFFATPGAQFSCPTSIVKKI